MMKNYSYFSKAVLVLFSSIAFSSSGHCFEISEKGYWIGDVPECHVHDLPLAYAVGDFLSEEMAESVVDFGCGMGEYVRHFQNMGFDAEGYDGNPNTPELTEGRGQIQDLSAPFDLERKFDWVMSLEVGEHLPHQYERIFMENLMRHANRGIILSWAVKNQGGTGHFNEQDNDYIKSVFALYGYTNDVQAENVLRREASVGWFKNTIMVFRK